MEEPLKRAFLSTSGSEHGQPKDRNTKPFTHQFEKGNITKTHTMKKKHEKTPKNTHSLVCFFCFEHQWPNHHRKNKNIYVWGLFLSSPTPAPQTKPKKPKQKHQNNLFFLRIRSTKTPKKPTASGLGVFLFASLVTDVSEGSRHGKGRDVGGRGGEKCSASVNGSAATGGLRRFDFFP